MTAAELTREELVERLAKAIDEARIEKAPGKFRSVGYYISVGMDALKHDTTSLARPLLTEAATAVLSELQALGLVIVPVEPTMEMCHAARDTEYAREFVKLVEAESTRLIGEPVAAPAHGSMMGYACWKTMLSSSPFAGN